MRSINTKIFVNLAVKHLERSKEFFIALGYTFNPKFTDDKAACLVISDDIYAMLLREKFFKTFTKKELVDAHHSTEALLALSMDSKAKVDEMFDLAISAGGRQSRPHEDLGFMYSKAFEDLDGHIWELFWMDPASYE